MDVMVGRERESDVLLVLLLVKSYVKGTLVEIFKHCEPPVKREATDSD